MQLSPNFTLAEMMRSEAAARRGIDNTPPAALIENLRQLCVNVLEPVRAHYARPVIVTSGYRSPAVNSAVGGSGTSQHSQGEAADFTVAGVPNIDVCRWMEKALTYDQLIYEFGESGWVHCSWRRSRLRNMELSAKRIGGKTSYIGGIVA